MAGHGRVLILGSGPAGLTAAVYAARAGLAPVLLHGIQPGGQMTITTDVENYPGFADVVQGPWLMEQMTEQARKVGTVFVDDLAVAIDAARRPFRVTGDSGALYEGDALIVATGAQAKWLGLESERRFQGFGVSACATCDGFFFRGKRVCVVGGGNTAVEEALYLTHHARSVTLIHRRGALRAENILQRRLLAHPAIDVLWHHVLEEVLGRDEPPNVTGIRVANVETGATTEMEMDGVFIAIGHRPNTDMARGVLAMDGEGYIATAADGTATSVAGIFAAGDVQDKVFRQAVTAAGSGCMAALEAEKFLAATDGAAADGGGRLAAE